MLNFSDRTRTGAFNVIWPLARERLIFVAQEPFAALCTKPLLTIHWKECDQKHAIAIWGGAKRVCDIEKSFIFRQNAWLEKNGEKRKMPTAPRVPRRSPIQVLTRLNVA